MYLHGFFLHNKTIYPSFEISSWSYTCCITGCMDTVWLRVSTWSRWMCLVVLSRGRCSLILLPCPLPGPGHHNMWSAIHIFPYLPGSLVTSVMWCPVLWGNSRHSYACSAIDISSIWIVSGSPLDRVTSDPFVDLSGISQIWTAHAVPHGDVSEIRTANPSIMRPQIYALDRTTTAIGTLELFPEPVAKIRSDMLLDVLQHHVLFSSATSHVRSSFFPATTLLNLIVMVVMYVSTISTLLCCTADVLLLRVPYETGFFWRLCEQSFC